MATRPSHTRTASTNLGTNASQRPLEGRVAIVTGASRGMCKPAISPPQTHSRRHRP
ncbi:predicted protein [Plenodomus lingam JN3]|uniref:Predicted protein n=1 Tax=Leptosphaeria maculans (strain JN3 / isolate v23.1.3 / race Av1-4-5-6-7-8) TaxID=985895 RepID=E5R4C4_LEPMJ|nr:predicted protein [Plenodomus lingam JN3]CBX91892.1 predicted protein [Plenodomus lingam JN3]